MENENEDKVIVAEFVDTRPPLQDEAPHIVDLTLMRSKKYVKSLLAGDAMETMKLLGDQMTVLLLAMNDQMLRWMEVLADPRSDRLERQEAGMHIGNLIGAASQMSETRIKLQVATGMDKLTQAGMAKPKLYEATAAVSPEEFVEKYKHLLPVGTPTTPVKPTN